MKESEHDRPHIVGIQIVAQGLDDLVDEVVFVGGAVAEFYATGPAAEEARISDDIQEGIECALPYSAESDSVEKILDILQFE